MHALMATELLERWEAGLSQSSWDWAHEMVSASFPEVDRRDLESLTVGELDARLLEVREALFGPTLNCRCSCPVCAATVDLSISSREVRIGSATAVRECDARVEDCCVHFRVPNTQDLRAAGREADLTRMRAVLLDRCVLAAHRRGERLELNDLPETARAHVVETMSNSDPHADVRLPLTCLACGSVWWESFDVVSYLWAEVESWAQHLLEDVHRLSSALGWREEDVLALSDQNRAHFLEMIDGDPSTGDLWENARSG